MPFPPVSGYSLVYTGYAIRKHTRALYSPKLVERVFSDVASVHVTVASCLWWKGMTHLGEVGRKGGRKDEVEPVRASRRFLRCPQRGQPPARRDVRWPWPSTGEQGGAGYGGVGTLSGCASKGRRPGG